MNRKAWRPAPGLWAGLAGLLVLPLTLGGCFLDKDGDLDFDLLLGKEVEANLNEQVAKIGGDTTAVARFVDDQTDTEWTLFNVANELSATPVQTTKGAVDQIALTDYIQDIEIVETETGRYALVAVSGAGIALVDVTNPSAMSVLHTTPVNYYQEGITFAEGGGDLVADAVIESVKAPIVALETDGTTLWIADEEYGIHRTALANVLGEAPATEDDGTLQIDAEVYTLQFAGEHPWGGPQDLQLHDGSLYAAQGFLGVGVFNPDTLEKIGYYNLYTDTSVTEDWFLDMDVADEVQPGNLDPDTGMPNYDQASFEIKEVWHNDVEAPTPWAEFDRYGKYYYNARSLDVAEFPAGEGSKTHVFVAYGLAGLVVLDATDPTDLSYLGYAPAVPAHGPDESTGEQSQSLFPYFGAGMLKEAGAVDVIADAANNRVFYSDHFAGLVALEGADDPAQNFRQAGAPFDNDSNPEEEHVPDYEFVTSYDMGAWDADDHESLPAWMYESPSVLVTGEISGHGSAFALADLLDPAADNVDVVLGNGAGGLDFIDMLALSGDMVDRYGVPVHFATTDEIGAAADGSPTADVSIGHTQGVATSKRYLYVADGPHGMSVWKIADSNGFPIDSPHLVANTLMEEYPVDTGSGTVYPTPHAYNNVLRGDNAFVLSQSLGLRRVDVSGAESGQGKVGAPLLLTPQPSDFYEHNLDTGSLGGIKRQDHAYDVDFHGDYAIVADGSNGLTVYDLTVDPTLGEGHIVANLGSQSGKPGLGRATGVEIWTNSADGRVYAFVAAGHAGIGVVDMTGLLRDGVTPGMEVVKVFEPIKIEEEDDGEIHIGKADSRSIDVDIVGNIAYYSYGGFGLLNYRISDLLAPLPEGVEPDKIWTPNGFDYRPEPISRFILQEQPGLEDADPEALYMTPQQLPARLVFDDRDRLLFYVGYGAAGVAKIDWSDPANPVLLQHRDTVGEATGTAIANGRVYVSDHQGGLVIFR